MDQQQGGSPQLFYIPNQYYTKYSQMGGWLLVFMVFFFMGLIFTCYSYISGFFLLILAIMQISDDSWMIMLDQYASIIIALMYFIPKTIAYINIMKKKPRFISLLIFSESIRIVSVIITLVLIFYFLEPVYNSIIIMIAAPPILFNITAIFYLTWSIRVRTYMGSDDYITKVLLMRLLRVKAPKPEAPYKAVHNTNPIYQSLLAPCQQAPMPPNQPQAPMPLDQSQPPPAPPSS